MKLEGVEDNKGFRGIFCSNCVKYAISAREKIDGGKSINALTMDELEASRKWLAFTVSNALHASGSCAEFEDAVKVANLYEVVIMALTHRMDYMEEIDW